MRLASILTLLLAATLPVGSVLAAPGVEHERPIEVVTLPESVRVIGSRHVDGAADNRMF